MATADMVKPDVGQPVERPPLWGGLDIEVIVVTGEFSSGKTLAALSICPGPETLVYDNEGSSVTYRSLGFQHVDMAKELLAKYGARYTPLQRYQWWKEDAIQRGKSGQFRVMVVDPFSEIEAGVAQYVQQHPGEFGYTADQFNKGGGIFWGAVKDCLKRDLDMLRVYFECVVLIVHMRDEWNGNRPSGKREAKGKSTLRELASLMLEMQRLPIKGGKHHGEVPAVPSANVLKSRLAHAQFVDGELQMVPILPPRLPVATPKAIREYIAQPADYSKLKKDEKLIEREMTAEEKLLLEAQIADARRDAAESEERAAARHENIAKYQAAQRTNAPQSPDQSANMAEATKTRAARLAAQANAPATDQQRADIAAKVGEAFTKVEFGEYLAAEGLNWGALTTAEADGVMSEIHRRIAAKRAPELEAKAAQLKAEGPAPGTPPSARVDETEPASEPEPEMEAEESDAGEAASDSGYTFEYQQEPGTITEEQIGQIKSLIEQTGWSRENQQRFCAQHKCESFRSISEHVAQELIVKLHNVASKMVPTTNTEGGAPKNT